VGQRFLGFAAGMVEEEIVLLHGFIKKQQQTPVQELTLAKKRKKNICKIYEKERSSWK
jgi:phage-related protein